jgi:hypothetical protein
MAEIKDSLAPPSSQKAKLPPLAYLVCGWPLLLVASGGAIGGGLGGAAFSLNLVAYRSKLPTPLKVVRNVAIGLAARGIWFAVAVAIQSYLRWQEDGHRPSRYDGTGGKLRHFHWRVTNV